MGGGDILLTICAEEMKRESRMPPQISADDVGADPANNRMTGALKQHPDATKKMVAPKVILLQ